jgi:HlyD family secretion protein
LVGIFITLKLAGIATPPSPTPIAAPIKRQAVTALGWLEPASNIVKLAAPATVEASRIARLEVSEGDPIEVGQVVAVLDTADKLKAQLKTAEAQVALKRALVARVRLDTENSIVARRMAIAKAQADLDQAEAEFARQRTLVGREFATPANLEKRKRDLEVARAQIEEAQSALRRLEATLSEPGQVPTQIDIAVAERELAAAEADFVQARVLLDQASIRSPIRGRVITVLTRPGEKISADGVMELGGTQTMVAIAEVYQSDLPLVRVGQPVELKSDTFTFPVTGVVERIGLKVKRQSVINNDPATDTDARVVEVRVILDPESSHRVAGMTRLQVRAHFKLEGH